MSHIRYLRQLAACFDRSLVITVISRFLSSKLNISVVRDSQVINLSRDPWVGMEHRSWRLPPTPQPSVLMESSQQFWEERMRFFAPLLLWWYLGCASVVHTAWEFCLNPVHLSVYTSLTVLNSLKFVCLVVWLFFFFTGRLTVASPCLWLIVLIAAVINYVVKY